MLVAKATSGRSKTFLSWRQRIRTPPVNSSVFQETRVTPTRSMLKETAINMQPCFTPAVTTKSSRYDPPLSRLGAPRCDYRPPGLSPPS